MRVRNVTLALSIVLGVAVQPARAADDATSRPAGVDEALWRRMVEVDARGAKITDLTADFQQEKFTPLLKKPLVSRGQIRVKGSEMVWDTKSPEPTVMAIGERQIRLYYPKQAVIEEYPIDQRLGSLAASPLPRLDVLRRYFTFEETDAAAAFPGVDPAGKLALKMKPIDDALREHLSEVRVLLDVAQGFILRAEMIDADSDRTRITFSDIKANAGLKDSDVRLPDVPPSVKVTRPLDGLGGGGAGDSGGARVPRRPKN